MDILENIKKRLAWCYKDRLTEEKFYSYDREIDLLETIIHAAEWKEKNEPHPWGVFLEARYQAILWMHNKQAYSDGEIAYKLSMDEEQVRQIRTHKE